MNQYDEAQIPLAGVCQAASLVKSVARSRDYSEDAFNTTIQSIVETDPANTVDVYGKLDNLKLGYEILVAQLGNRSSKDAEITRYVVSLLTLERKLSKTRGKLGALADRIDNIKRQSGLMSLFESQMMGNLASVYKDNISPMSHKIQVAGEPAALKQTSTQDKIRALLLGGIRSAVLWRQLGGTRRSLIFQRTKILQSAQSSLQIINQTL